MVIGRKACPMLQLPFQFRLTVYEKRAKFNGPRPCRATLVATLLQSRPTVSMRNRSTPRFRPWPDRLDEKEYWCSCMDITTVSMRRCIDLPKSSKISKAPVIPVLFSWPSRGLTQLSAYKDDFDSANYSRGDLRRLLRVIALNRDVDEVTVLCHSMGCWPALEALEAKDKVRNVLLVAPDVDVHAFRTEIRRLGSSRPHIALFVAQDDQALKLSRLVWGGKPRLGDASSDHEPNLRNFEREGVMVFDVTHLEGNSHSKALENPASVMGMIERRLAEGQQMTDSGPRAVEASQ